MSPSRTNPSFVYVGKSSYGIMLRRRTRLGL